MLFMLLAFVVTIIVIVAIHEYGHYLAMRAFGVRVLTFSIGFGPRLLQWRSSGDTDFVISAIPLGGYVKPLDRRDCDVDPADQASEFSGKPAWQRVITYAAGPAANESGAFSQVLGSLEKVFLVAATSQSAADLMRLHDALWQWVEKLSPDRDQHELAILFVMPVGAEGITNALAAGLGMESFRPDVPGHGLAKMEDSLQCLLAAAGAIIPQDLPPLRARLAADERHAVLAELKLALTGEGVLAAARRVNEVFHKKEYLLDLFCRPPSHRNGNRLRAWLSKVVTQGVTPCGEAGSDQCPSDWLDETRFP